MQEAVWVFFLKHFILLTITMFKLHLSVKADNVLLLASDPGRSQSERNGAEPTKLHYGSANGTAPGGCSHGRP